MTRDPSDENKNLPPWLRDVPLPPRPRSADESAAATASSASTIPVGPPSSTSLPDWLRPGADALAAEPAASEAGEAEPAAWMIDKTDPIGNRQGAPGLFVDAEFGAYIDNLKIVANQ